MPEHTFYVDNLYVYEPLLCVRTLFYLDVDLYRYFIGRPDQSVNEHVMIRRIDQQLKVNRMMMDVPVSPYAVPGRALSVPVAPLADRLRDLVDDALALGARRGLRP